jgi:hypothetical protein
MRLQRGMMSDMRSGRHSASGADIIMSAPGASDGQALLLLAVQGEST